MSRIILIFLVSSQFILSQSLHSPENRKLFADHLFCNDDYLRAILEYDEYLKYYSNDTISFKIALGYSKIENYNEAAVRFQSISPQSEFYLTSRLEYIKSKIKAEDFTSVVGYHNSRTSVTELKLINISYLLSEMALPVRESFLIPFNDSEKQELQTLHELKNNPPYKSATTAGLLSALIPGSGKIYTGQISEGITAFLLNGLFAFISYNNFKNNHNARGWIFAGVGAFFYAGNIYGSAVSARVYNSRFDFEYGEQVKQYLESQNYFIDEYEFCN